MRHAQRSPSLPRSRLERADAPGRRLTYFTVEDGLSDNQVRAIHEDRDGNIWFGTVEHGVWRCDGETLKHCSARDGLTTKDVMCIYADRRGDLWLAGNGVFRFNGASFDRMY